MDRVLRINPRYHRWHVDEGVEWIEPNTGYAHLEWEIPLSEAALVLVDVWDRHYLKDAEARAEEIIQSRIRPLLTSCRESGLEVIHAPSPPQANEHPAWQRRFGSDDVKKKKSESDGTWPPADFRYRKGAYAKYAMPHEVRDAEREALRAAKQMHEDVQVEGDEVVVATGDELHRYCSEQGILFLFFLGFNTNACVLMRDYGTVEMAKRGYGIVILRNCTTGMESPETHNGLGQTRGAILFLEMFGKFSLTSDELIAGLPTPAAS